MDARRNQVYTGIYEFCKAEAEAGSCEQQLVMHCVKDQCASPVDELVDELNRLGREVTFWETVCRYTGSRSQKE